MGNWCIEGKSIMGCLRSHQDMILDVLESCGIKRDSVSCSGSLFIFRKAGVVVSFKASIEDDGYGLFSGEMYDYSLSDDEVKVMHLEIEKTKNPVSGDINDMDKWVRLVRRYNYRHVFEFGKPVHIVPMIVGLADMSIEEYIVGVAGKGITKSFLDSKDSFIGGSLRKSIGVYN